MKLKIALALTPALLLAQQTPAPPEPAVAIEPIRTSITVVEKLEAPVSGYVSAFNEDSLEARPGVNLDERLRDVPGFTLFRRSSSLVAHPTTQGVSLRGIGSSAASRTLVLYDGIPIGDPFGGWVYWSRFNPDSIDVIEISRGASSSVYGDRAMGGAISILTPTPENRRFWVSSEGGSAGIADARGGYQDLFGKVGVSTFVRGFRSEGYYIIPEDIRGPVDRRADVDFVAGDLKLDYFGSKNRLIFKTNIVAEQRQNATALRENNSGLGTAGLTYLRGGFTLSGYHSRGRLFSTFTGVNATRTVENLTLLQDVDAQDSGGSVIWKRGGGRSNLFIGADTHRASGASVDTVTFSGLIRDQRGKLWQQGAFVQGDLSVGSRTQLLGGIRHDFSDRGNDFWSPRGGIAVADGPRRWRASVYRSFRAPTLNEYFRQFRVGNVTTLGNELLTPETMFGVEAGMDWRIDTFLLRTTIFRQRIDDLIANVTLSGGNFPVRQRQNLGFAVGRGAEIELQKSFGPMRLETAYLYIDSQVSTNFFMPQTARHQGNALLIYAKGKMLVSGGIRSSSLQFEDDLNTFVMPGYSTIQFLVKRRLGHGVSGMVAVENILNRSYIAGFTPEATTGTPRLLRVGLKWESGS